MNRKTKTIIFWIVAGILIAGFVLMLFFGSIYTLFGAGTSIYNSVGKFLLDIGLNRSDVFTWAPYICVACGILLSFLFYKRYNSRIN